jgi:hypothetical protein
MPCVLRNTSASLRPLLSMSIGLESIHDKPHPEERDGIVGARLEA